VVRRLKELRYVKVHAYTGVIASVSSRSTHCIQQWTAYLRSPLPRAKTGIPELYMHTIRRPTCLHESLRVNARLEPECSAMIETLSCCSVPQGPKNRFSRSRTAYRSQKLQCDGANSRVQRMGVQTVDLVTACNPQVDPLLQNSCIGAAASRKIIFGAKCTGRISQVYIPRDLRPFFLELVRTVSFASPTVFSPSTNNAQYFKESFL
jgi:hypothetical protein